MTKPVLTVVAVLLTLLYPLAVYLLIDEVDPRVLLLGIGMLIIARLALGPLSKRPALLAGSAILLSIAIFASIKLAPETAVLFYPVLVNVAALSVFAASLFAGPPVIERIARLTEPDLPPSGIRYTRQVTIVWCGFFVLNGSVALLTAIFTSVATWALYNGLIAYLLMGTLFAGEWIVRQRVRGKQKIPAQEAAQINQGSDQADV